MDFQKLLLHVGKALSRDEVKALVFLCTDLLSRSSTSVELASDLFSRLVNQDCLSPEQPQLLTELLQTIQRTRLLRDLRINNQTSNLISPYRKLLYNLSEDITDDDLKQVKFLLNKELPRRKLDENVTTLEVFLEMEHLDLISSTDLSLMESILDSVCPVLKEKISRFKATQERSSGHVAQETSQPMSVSHPFEQNQGPLPLVAESSASHERLALQPSSEFSMNMASTSAAYPNTLLGGDEHEGLSQGMRQLSTRTSNYDSSEERTDAVEMSLPQEDKTSTKPKTFRPLLAENTDEEGLGMYPMTSAKRGFCLIVNNENFKGGLKKREGTMVDEKNLHIVFTWLGFDIIIRRECTSGQMQSIMKDLARQNHSQNDCLVCFILSHGQEQSVYGVDGHTVEVQHLMDPFNGSLCSSLANKPKMFFIQACQGNREQQPVYIETDSRTESYVSRDSKVFTPSFHGSNQQPTTKSSIPSNADFLMGMATVPSFVSFRERSNGTWFIQSLCQNLVQMVPRGADIVSILTKVNADVSKKTDHTGQRKQMPQPTFTLRHKVVFPIPIDPRPIL
ncbi:caspase-8 isoform X1 [Scomber japonicus]|uniref:caspase-8 isoform X1 n=1 Tax=Scomber japonicus TaxID=13676 RepID=UPI0023067EE3|nr:caspase-8 isoform X1 [Scomber japonicus]